MLAAIGVIVIGYLVAVELLKPNVVGKSATRRVAFAVPALTSASATTRSPPWHRKSSSSIELWRSREQRGAEPLIWRSTSSGWQLG
jgi:hypothetical protein